MAKSRENLEAELKGWQRVYKAAEKRNDRAGMQEAHAKANEIRRQMGTEKSESQAEAELNGWGYVYNAAKRRGDTEGMAQAHSKANEIRAEQGWEYDPDSGKTKEKILGPIKRTVNSKTVMENAKIWDPKQVKPMKPTPTRTVTIPASSYLTGPRVTASASPAAASMQQKTGDDKLKELAQRVVPGNEDKWSPEGIAKGFGYGAERTLSGAAGALEDAARFVSGYGNKLLSGITSLGGLADNPVSDYLARTAENTLSNSFTDRWRTGIEERYQPDELSQKIGDIGEAAGAMLPTIAAELASSDELLESFISGVALSGIMQGGAGIAGRIASRSVRQSLDVNALGENSRKNYIAQMERDGGTTRGFQEQWKQYNDGGNAGIPFAQVPGEPTTIGMSRAYAAHAAGLNDYQARMKKNAPEGTQYKFADHPVPTREQLEQKPDMKVVDIRGRRQGHLSEQRKQFLASKQARRLYEQPVINRDTGEPVFITPATMTHTFSNPGADQIGVAEHIGEIIENAVLTHAEPITHGNQSATGIYTLFGAVQTERGVQPVKIKVKEYDYKGQYLPKTIKDYFIRNGQQDEFASAYDGRVLMLESIEKEDASSSAATMPETSSGVNHPSASSQIFII